MSKQNQSATATSSFGLLEFVDGKLSDYQAAIQLNHRNEGDTSCLIEYGDRDLLLCGTVTISTPEGALLSGDRVLDLVNEGVCSKEELIDWLHGKEGSSGLTDDYVVLSNPWFEWTDSNGNPVCEVFDEIDKSVEANVKLLNEIIE